MEKLIQIEQVLQIEAKLLQIGAVPVVTNRSSSYYKSRQFQLLQIRAKLLQIEAVITNWGRIITSRGRYYKFGQLLRIGAEQFQVNLIFQQPLPHENTIHLFCHVADRCTLGFHFWKKLQRHIYIGYAKVTKKSPKSFLK